MAKRLVQMRLELGLLEWADGYAASREWSRTQLVEAALASFRVDVAGGVPERPDFREAAERRPVPGPNVENVRSSAQSKGAVRPVPKAGG